MIFNTSKEVTIRYFREFPDPSHIPKSGEPQRKSNMSYDIDSFFMSEDYFPEELFLTSWESGVKPLQTNYNIQLKHISLEFTNKTVAKTYFKVILEMMYKDQEIISIEEKFPQLGL